ncbi:MAG: hypothetical protein GY866_26520 [Proteobacteria bacterium]|nr:hypothetical protein [Pseudomonadota bacterium]
MEASREEIQLKLDPQIQELYSRLEEEKKKNENLKALQEENAKLTERINQLETEKAKSKKEDPKTTVLRTKKKIALQEQLQAKKLQDEMLETKQNRIENLLESLDDQQDIHELDSKSINELIGALDSLRQSQNKRKEVVKKLNQKNKILMEENEDLKFMRTKLAHDLRSLMSSILGTMSLIDLGEKEVVEQLLPSLEARCHIFMNLINAINGAELNQENLMVDSIISLLNLEIEGTQKQIKTEVSGYDTRIFGDKAVLYDVIQNLINNSRKYAGLKPEDLVIKIDVSENDQSTLIKIADNGIGIAPDKQEKIFDLFDRAGRDDKAGKGIGLYMVKRLVEDHNGTISYDNDYSEGAQFVVTLPKTA